MACVAGVGDFTFLGCLVWGVCFDFCFLYDVVGCGYVGLVVFLLVACFVFCFDDYVGFVVLGL